MGPCFRQALEQGARPAGDSIWKVAWAALPHAPAPFPPSGCWGPRGSTTGACRGRPLRRRAAHLELSSVTCLSLACTLLPRRVQRDPDKPQDLRRALPEGGRRAPAPASLRSPRGPGLRLRGGRALRPPGQGAAGTRESAGRARRRTGARVRCRAQEMSRTAKRMPRERGKRAGQVCDCACKLCATRGAAIWNIWTLRILAHGVRAPDRGSKTRCQIITARTKSMAAPAWVVSGQGGERRGYQTGKGGGCKMPVSVLRRW